MKNEAEKWIIHFQKSEIIINNNQKPKRNLWIIYFRFWVTMNFSIFYCCPHAFKLWFIYICILFPFLFSLLSISQGKIIYLLPPTPTLQTPVNVLFWLLIHICLAPLVSQAGVLFDLLLFLYLSSSYFAGLNLFRSVQNLLLHSSAPKSHCLEKNPLLILCLRASQLSKWTYSHSIKASEWIRKNIPSGKYCKSWSPREYEGHRSTVRNLNNLDNMFDNSNK